MILYILQIHKIKIIISIIYLLLSFLPNQILKLDIFMKI